MAAGFIRVFLCCSLTEQGEFPLCEWSPESSRQRARTVPASFLAMPGKWPWASAP